MEHGRVDEAHLVIVLFGLIKVLQGDLASSLHVITRDGDCVVAIRVKSFEERLSCFEHSWLLLKLPVVGAQFSEA